MKKILVLLFSLLLTLVMVNGVYASQNHVSDTAGIFTSEEVDELNEKFDSIEAEYDVSIFFALDTTVANDDIVDHAREILTDTTASTGVVMLLNSDYYFIDAVGEKADQISIYYEYLWNTFYNANTYYGGVMAFGDAVASLVGEKTGNLPVMQSVPVLENKASVVDMADLLSDSEEQALASKIAGVSARQGIDIVVVTTNSLNGLSATKYADDFYDLNGFRNDGVIFLVSMEDRDYAISTKGYCTEALTDYGCEYIASKTVSYLSDGNYSGAFNKFTDLTDEFVTQAKNGSPYDINNTKRTYSSFYFFLCPALGLLAASLRVGGLKGQLRSVYAKHQANSYIVPGSLNISRSRDTFISRDVQRTPRPERETSSGGSRGSGGSTVHISSSGSFHGGSSGKF